jgi:hypothetical protein
MGAWKYQIYFECWTWYLTSERSERAATIIHDFFADLTKDYPQINKEWIELECPDSLPSVSVEDVRKYENYYEN